MISTELVNKLKFESILGYFGISELDGYNPYFGTFNFKRNQFILFQSQSGLMCLNSATLSRFSPIEFLLVHIQNRSASNIDQVIEQVLSLPDHIFCTIPQLLIIKESQLLPNYLGLSGESKDLVIEESEPELFQFANSLGNANCQLFKGKRPNENVLCIYQDKKLVNAITFNLGSRIRYLSRKGFEIKITNSESKKRTYISNINYLINSKRFLDDEEVILFKQFPPFLPRKKIEPGYITTFIIGIADYTVVLQYLFSLLVEKNIFSSASIHYDKQSDFFAIHISGYGKKPFTIDQIGEPIKSLIRNALNDGDPSKHNPYQSLIFNESYFLGQGDLIQYTNSRENDLVINLPLNQEIMIPLFNHFSELTEEKLELKITQ